MSISRSIAQPLSQPIVKSLTGKLLWQSIKQTLFGAGSEGGLYPIGDLLRQGQLYTDSALSTVLTDAGDPLGGANDLSGNSNPLTQATDTDRPVYGIVPFGGRRNLLLNTDFSGAVSGTPGTKPDAWLRFNEDGALTYDPDDDSLRVAVVSGRDQFGFNLSGAAEANTDYTLSVFVNVIDTVPDIAAINFAAAPTGATYTHKIDGSVVTRGDNLPLGEHLVEATVHIDGTSGDLNPRIGVGITGATTGDIVFKRPQLDVGDSRTNYQLVGDTEYEVTEAGKSSAHVLFFNGTNQEIGSDYPAGTYTICLAGINGAWIEEISHAGGAFDLGPGTYTGGPENMLETVGNVVAFVPMEGSITSAQKARLLQYLAQLGCPGEITLTTEYVGTPTYTAYGDNTVSAPDGDGFVTVDYVDGAAGAICRPETTPPSGVPALWVMDTRPSPGSDIIPRFYDGSSYTDTQPLAGDVLRRDRAVIARDGVPPLTNIKDFSADEQYETRLVSVRKLEFPT